MSMHFSDSAKKQNTENPAERLLRESVFVLGVAEGCPPGRFLDMAQHRTLQEANISGDALKKLADKGIVTEENKFAVADRVLREADLQGGLEKLTGKWRYLRGEILAHERHLDSEITSSIIEEARRHLGTKPEKTDLEGAIAKIFDEARSLHLKNPRSRLHDISSTTKFFDSRQVCGAEELIPGRKYQRARIDNDGKKHTSDSFEVIKVDPEQGNFDAKYSNGKEQNHSLSDNGVIPYSDTLLWNTNNYLLPLAKDGSILPPRVENGIEPDSIYIDVALIAGAHDDATWNTHFFGPFRNFGEMHAAWPHILKSRYQEYYERNANKSPYGRMHKTEEDDCGLYLMVTPIWGADVLKMHKPDNKYLHSPADIALPAEVQKESSFFNTQK